jgi:hypothetical protein
MTNEDPKPTCLKCEQPIKGVGIYVYGKDCCLNCYNEAVKQGIINPMDNRI